MSGKEDDTCEEARFPNSPSSKTAPRAELLAIWTVTLRPPFKSRAGRELLATALVGQLKDYKFGGLASATKPKVRVLERNQRSIPPAINLCPGAGHRKPIKEFVETS